jgi:methylenetetrahydrofolate reductase (NADPH)
MLWECLQRKVAHLESEGLDVEITTQLAFDAEAVVAWVERVRRSGIQSLIRIGVPAPATTVGLIQFAAQCRVTTSLISLQKHGWQTPSMPERVSPENFLVNLQRGLDRRSLGNIAYHIFPLGDLPLAVQWFQTF